MANCRDCSKQIRQGPGRPRIWCAECRPPKVEPRSWRSLCIECGELLPERRLKYCSDGCLNRNRERHARPLWCADCGAQMYTSRTSLEQGLARCRPCRRLMPRRKKKKKNIPRGSCLDCSATCWGARCRSCANKAQIVRSQDDERTFRRQRETAAPGLTGQQRRNLLHQWIASGAHCAYCPALASTIDHVIALVRGGTNYEGNLVPACRRCNGSKNARTIMEWKLGRKVKRMRHTVTWPAKPKAKPQPTWSGLRLSECAHCGALTTRRKYCGAECGTRGAAIAMRNSYRLKVGIPLDAPVCGVEVNNSLQLQSVFEIGIAA